MHFRQRSTRRILFPTPRSALRSTVASTWGPSRRFIRWTRRFRWTVWLRPMWRFRAACLPSIRNSTNSWGLLVRSSSSSWLCSSQACQMCRFAVPLPRLHLRWWRSVISERPSVGATFRPMDSCRVISVICCADRSCPAGCTSNRICSIWMKSWLRFRSRKPRRSLPPKRPSRSHRTMLLHRLSRSRAIWISRSRPSSTRFFFRRWPSPDWPERWGSLTVLSRSTDWRCSCSMVAWWPRAVIRLPRISSVRSWNFRPTWPVLRLRRLSRSWIWFGNWCRYSPKRAAIIQCRSICQRRSTVRCRPICSRSTPQASFVRRISMYRISVRSMRWPKRWTTMLWSVSKRKTWLFVSLCTTVASRPSRSTWRWVISRWIFRALRGSTSRSITLPKWICRRVLQVVCSNP